MKKLFSLLTLALLTMSAWAATEVTFDYTVDTGTWTTAGEFTVTKGDVTLAFSNGTINQAYRVYASSTLTISSASDNITKIEFTCTSGNPASNFAAFDGFNTSTGVWTGDAESVEFTANTQVRATLIKVTIGEGETPVEPEPDPKTYKKVTSTDELVAGQKYIIVEEDASCVMTAIGNSGGLAESVTINSGVISTANALELTLGGSLDAASFSYDNNGTTTYMTPANKSLSASDTEYAAWVIDQSNFTLSATIGETVYTLRYNSGATSGPFRCYSSTTGKIAHLYVYDENATPVEPPVENEIESLEITADLANDYAFTFTGNAGVSYQKGAYMWLRDETGYGLIYGSTNEGANPVFTPGTMLNPGWKATTSIYNGLMEFVNTTGLDSIGFNADYAVPQTITALDNADMINAYVKVENVKSFSVSGKNVTATLADGTTTMAMRKTFDDTEVPTTPGNYTVYGAVSIYNTTLQLTIISIEGEYVADPTLPASCEFEESMTVEITHADAEATIKYSYDNQTWNEYTEALTITETTTVYAKAVKGNLESNVVSATYTKIEPTAIVTYTLVTDVNELADGDKIILVGYCATEGDDLGKAYAMAGYRGDHYSNFATVEVTVENNTVTTGLANVITLEANGDFWNFKAEEGYLYAASSEKNYMMVTDEPDDNAKAAIYMDTDSMSIIFQGENTRNHLRYNYNNGSPLFSCYAQGSSVQTPAYIFKAQTQEPPVEVKRGDVNKDGDVTISDVTALIDALLSGSLDEADDFSPANADANLDESISIGDVTAIIDYLLSHVWPE